MGLTFWETWFLMGCYYGLIVHPACHYVAYRMSMWQRLHQLTAEEVPYLDPPLWGYLVVYLFGKVLIIIAWPYYLFVKILTLLFALKEGAT